MTGAGDFGPIILLSSCNYKNIKKRFIKKNTLLLILLEFQWSRHLIWADLATKFMAAQ